MLLKIILVFIVYTLIYFYVIFSPLRDLVRVRVRVCMRVCLFLLFSVCVPRYLDLYTVARREGCYAKLPVVVSFRKSVLIQT